MPEATLVLDAPAIQRALTRIAHEIAERNATGGEVVVIGIQSGGAFLAQRLSTLLADIWGHAVPNGLQCGFCTPGQIMSAIGLIGEGQAGADPERVREGMSGNLCRCGAYAGITEAVLDAQKQLAETSKERAA